MADYIVDTSIIMQRFIRETYTEQTRRLFERLTKPDEFHIPQFGLVECVNVFWKKVRFEAMPQAEADILASDLLSYPFTILPVEDVLPRALQIGIAHKLAIYDSVHIAMAEKYTHPLITADAGQEAAARAIGVTIKPITDF
jgi:predicted nucleic acid-binding protein